MTLYDFDGHAYEAEHDQQRLSSQYDRVFSIMTDGMWRTYNEIEILTRDPQCSISACLRNMRKPRFGGHTVERQARGDREDGLFEYRLIVNDIPPEVTCTPEYIHSGKWVRVEGNLDVKVHKRAGRNLTDLERSIIVQKVKDAVLAAEAEIRTRRNKETPSTEHEVWDDVHYWTI
jgi:hypothetical protein